MSDERLTPAPDTTVAWLAELCQLRHDVETHHQQLQDLTRWVTTLAKQVVLLAEGETGVPSREGLSRADIADLTEPADEGGSQ